MQARQKYLDSIRIIAEGNPTGLDPEQIAKETAVLVLVKCSGESAETIAADVFMSRQQLKAVKTLPNS